MKRFKRYKEEYPKLIELISQNASNEKIEAQREIMSDIWEDMPNEEYHECINWWFKTYCDTEGKMLNEI